LRDSRGFADLPDRFYDSIDFNKPISCAAISHHGFIFGVGCRTGAVFCCDTRSLGNHRMYTSHSCEVTAVAFSRDTLHIASGDRSGHLKVHSVETETLEFQHQFAASIRFLQYSPTSNGFLLVLLDSSDLVVIDPGGAVAACSLQFTCAQWCHSSFCFLGAREQRVFEIALPEFTVVKVRNFGDSKVRNISSICVARNDRFFVFLDSTGIGHCYDIPTEKLCGHYFDAIDRGRFVHVAIDRNSEIVLLARKGTWPEVIQAYNVELRRQVRNFTGPCCSSFAIRRSRSSTRARGRGSGTGRRRSGSG
jgi:WD40 repeat protein